MRSRLSRREFLSLSGGVTGMALLAAGAPATSKAQAAAQPAAPTSAEGGRLRPAGNPQRGGTVRIAVGVNTSDFDIQLGGAAHVLCQLYNNLVRFNLVDGLRSVGPDLAESWETSEDGLTYIFHLRQGVKFHDDEPFSADDVVATFKRILSPPQGVIIPGRAEMKMVETVEKFDDATVIFTLSSPRANFLQLLSATWMVIFSQKTLEGNLGDRRAGQVPPGTGAFKFVEYRADEKWTFERNPDYWDQELPYIDTLEFLHVPAWSDRGTAVLTDQADLSWNVAPDSVVDFATRGAGERGGDSVQVNQIANFGAYWVLFNIQKPPFGDSKVRLAIHLAINRQNLIEAFATQEQIRLTRWIPADDPYATAPEEIANLPGYREDKSDDINVAKALLAEAGFGDGIQGLELLAATGPQTELLAHALQEMLANTIGVQIEIRTVERTRLLEEEEKGNFTLVLDTFGHVLSDLSPRANLWWRTGGSSNWGGYSNPDFDSLLAGIDVEIDEDKRQDLINRALDLLDQDPPCCLIGYTHHLLMWRTSVQGLMLDQRAFAEWGRVETVWLGANRLYLPFIRAN